eukprot:5112430-Karenia_brevis.AAC.1
MSGNKKGGKSQIRHFWKRLEAALAQCPPETFRMRKVKGHAKSRSVTSGRVEQPDRFGNFRAGYTWCCTACYSC